MKLSEKQWEKVAPLIPDGPVREDGKGRPWKDKRTVLEGVLWIVWTGARWRDLPTLYPPYQTCHRRFQQWVESGVFEQVIETLAKDLQERGAINMSECFIDGTFSLAKKGLLVGTTKRGKGTKVMRVTDAGGVVLSIAIESANPHEVTLVEKTLAERFVKELPEKLIGDKAYDSDPLDQRLEEQGVKLIAPHKTNRKKKATQDGRKLRRYKRRWKVERFFAWLFNYRRCIVRHENKHQNFKAVLLLACIMIYLKSYFHL